jgi:hypothetical protein
MVSETGVTGADQSTDTVYSCIRCGIESQEVTCFVGITKSGRQQSVHTCITCSQPDERNSHGRHLFGIAAILLLPIFFLSGFRGGKNIVLPPLLLAAFLMQPLTVLLHEMGHFLTARWLGLEPWLIRLGVGPQLWAGRFLGVPLRVHGWPLSGLTYLGSASLRFLRLRVWITILMGPGTNLLLAAISIICWDPSVRVFGTNVVLLWIIYNGLYLLSSLLPNRHRRVGQLYRSDGLQLMLIPFKKREDLAVYLSATP